MPRSERAPPPRRDLLAFAAVREAPSSPFNSTRPGMHRQQEAVRYTVVLQCQTTGPSRPPPVGRLERNVAHVSEAAAGTPDRSSREYVYLHRGRPVSQTNDVGVGISRGSSSLPGPPGWGAAASLRLRDQSLLPSFLCEINRPAGRPAPERLSSG